MREFGAGRRQKPYQIGKKKKQRRKIMMGVCEREGFIAGGNRFLYATIH